MSQDVEVDFIDSEGREDDCGFTRGKDRVISGLLVGVALNFGILNTTNGINRIKIISSNQFGSSG